MLVLNRIRPTSYVIQQTGYVVYKFKIKIENRQTTKEILKPLNIVDLIDLFIHLTSEINLLNISIYLLKTFPKNMLT
jgi:hypothetical protein